MSANRGLTRHSPYTLQQQAADQLNTVTDGFGTVTTRYRFLSRMAANETNQRNLTAWSTAQLKHDIQVQFNSPKITCLAA